MKIVVVGGSGLIGSRVVAKLEALGHDALAASPKSGVNAVTGEGLAEALEGAQVVVDVANSPSFEAAAAMEFFERAGHNLFAAEERSGVRHHVALSVVGTERLLASGYFRAKLAQERLIKSSGVPYSIVRATQFYEFIGAVAQDATVNGIIRAPTALMQPMASEDVASAVVDVTLRGPVGGTVEIGGPEAIQVDNVIRMFLAEQGDLREVITDDGATYFGLTLNRTSLTPGAGARLASTRFGDWLRYSAPRPHPMVG